MTARVLVVIGTRPEGIKLAPVITELRSYAPDIETHVILTGQHIELIQQVLDVFEIPVDRNLKIMREGQDLYDIAMGCLTGLRDYVKVIKPNLILVEGDTASVFFGALVGFFEQRKVGHVEAGLRSHNKLHPYPEEVFRRLTGVAADLHFAPTKQAKENLLKEAVPPEQVFVTGNTVVDALQHVVKLGAPMQGELAAALQSGKKLVLVTAHRRESFGAPIRAAFGAIRTLADQHEDALFFYPVHPNPEVRRAANEVLSGHPRIQLTEPLDYFDLVHALSRAHFVLTDSGGIQEEAPTFGTPVLVMREVTERPEAQQAGVAELVGTDPQKIVSLGTQLLSGNLREKMSRPGSNPYGDGHAAKRIADIVNSDLTGQPRTTTDWQ